MIIKATCFDPGGHFQANYR